MLKTVKEKTEVMHISDKIDIWTKFLQDKNILNNRGQGCYL